MQAILYRQIYKNTINSYWHWKQASQTAGASHLIWTEFLCFSAFSSSTILKTFWIVVPEWCPKTKKKLTKKWTNGLNNFAEVYNIYIFACYAGIGYMSGPVHAHVVFSKNSSFSACYYMHGTQSIAHSKTSTTNYSCFCTLFISFKWDHNPPSK